MIKQLAFISLMFLFWNSLLAQEQKEVMISRIAGFQKMSELDSVRVMGFTQALKQKVALPGPMLEYKEGDSIEIMLWNVSQGPPHTIHLHGLDVDQQNDGVPTLSFAVGHMEKGYYKFKAPHPGTYLYHCHVISPLHVQAGMYGMLVVKPKRKDLSNYTWENGYRFYGDYRFLLNEIDRNWHTEALFNHKHDPDSMEHELPIYEPQYFLINSFSQEQDDDGANEVHAFNDEHNTLLRLANIGNLYNQYIFPEKLEALVISSDGRPLPNAWRTDTLEILPGERYQVLLQPKGQETYTDSIRVEYRKLENDKVAALRFIRVYVSQFVSDNRPSEAFFDIYPNPARSQIFIETNNDLKKQVKILDLSGKVVLCQVSSNERLILNLSGLSPGFYYIKVQIENTDEISLKKLIIH